MTGLPQEAAVAGDHGEAAVIGHAKVVDACGGAVQQPQPRQLRGEGEDRGDGAIDDDGVVDGPGVGV